MAKGISPLYIGAGAVGLYLLLKSPGPAVPGQTPTGLASLLPSGLLPGTPAASAPTTYGINSGIKGGNGSFYTCANHAQLLAVNPNLGNPNYQMTAAEANQYLANYQDLQTGLPQWIGHNDNTGMMISSLPQACQSHWHNYGCAEQRIFLPLQPPSTAAYIPPPPNPKATSSGGSSFLSSALQVAGSVAIALLGKDNGIPTVLSEADVNVMVTGSAILKNILPFYLQVDPNLVHSIDNKIDSVISQYQD